MSGLDLFGGGGGWSFGHGLDTVGIEIDDYACQTRRAAGLKTLQADVGALNPPAVSKMMGGVEFMTASAPCPPFSMAGHGYGRGDRDILKDTMSDMAVGRDTRREAASVCRDERSILTVEPLRWAMELEPEWMIWEQVSAVLDVWEHAAEILGALGYNVWTGLVDANQYGVAQTRKRAILMAHRTLPVAKPPPMNPGMVMSDVLDFTNEVALRMGRARGTRRTIDQPAPTIAFGKSASGVVFELEDGTDRQITIAEAATLQGFPDGYPFLGGHVAAFSQIGDAVPPPMSKALVEALTTSALIA